MSIQAADFSGIDNGVDGGNEVATPEEPNASNDLIHRAVAGIAEIITVAGMISLSIADVRMILSGTGMTLMGSAVASGAGRTKIAAKQAIANLVVQGVDMTNVCRVLINITSTSSLKIKDACEVLKCVKFAAAENALINIGTAVDETMVDELRVTLFAINVVVQ